MSFADRHAPESLLPRFSPPVEGALNIAMLHSSLAGAAGHDTYAPCSVADLAGMDFDYWALGHIHKRQVHSQSPWIVMPGIPQGRDIGEAGPKSASLLTIEDGKITVEEVPTSVVEFTQTSLNITEADSDDALRGLIRDHISTIRGQVAASTVVLRLIWTGQPTRYWQILRDQDVWQQQIAEIAQSVGDLWIDKLIFEFTAPDAREHAVGVTSATDELATFNRLHQERAWQSSEGYSALQTAERRLGAVAG